jgi:hypothetical protein
MKTSEAFSFGGEVLSHDVLSKALASALASATICHSGTRDEGDMTTNRETRQLYKPEVVD